MKQKKVLTIIVTYNAMAWAEKCLMSLRSSSVPTDVIVIDNKSTDDTVHYIKNNFPEVKLVESDKNLGFGKANNIGLDYGIEKEVDYFFLLNQDAWVFDDTLEKLIQNFDKNPQYGIISPVQLSANLEVETIFKSYISRYKALLESYNEKKIYKEDVHEVDFCNAAMWLISKKCIKSTGGFSPVFYHYGEDADYVNRVVYHGFKVGVSGNAFGIHDRKLKSQKTVREFNKLKKHPGPWPLKYYIILSNINYSAVKSLALAMLLFLKSIVKHTLQANWFSFKYDFIVIAEVIRKIPYVLSIREIVKKKEYSFLKKE